MHPNETENSTVGRLRRLIAHLGFVPQCLVQPRPGVCTVAHVRYMGSLNYYQDVVA